MNKSFESFLIANSVLGFHPELVTFKSGIKSRWYVNCRKLAQRLSVLEESAVYITQFISDQIKVDGIDAVIGVPEGVSELANAVSRKMIVAGQAPSDKLYTPRVKPKEHGDPANKFWVNGNIPSKVIVLEDVTTTGGSAISFIEKLKESNVTVVAVVALVNRLHRHNGKTVVESFAEIGVPYFSLTTAEKILPDFIATFPEGERAQLQQIIDAEYVA
jgi:orotate phosphoribosyltransferase